jgi:Rrf2 family protein
VADRPGRSICENHRVRVTAKSDYALRALIEMAVRESSQGAEGRSAISAEELGRAQGIPHGFLQAILADLRKAGIVASQRGPSGGWRLAREADEVSVADVTRAVDGPLVSVHGLRPESVTYNERADVLQHVWIAARDSLREVLEQVTIGQLAGRALPEEVTVRTAREEAWQSH